MKSGFAIVCLFIAGMSMPAIATTLKLDQNIELIVVDGQKVSGSLLKGADSLELDNGQHQILFKVVKTAGAAANPKITYTSPALIAIFDAQKLASVSFKLPPLETKQERKKFDQQPNYQLIDGNHQIIPTRIDILNVTDDELAHHIEKKISEYNSANHNASVARFAAAKPSVKTDRPEEWPVTDALDDPTPSSTLFSIMQYWFQMADKETQQLFLHWMHGKDTH
ncbi:DUF2057 family protein [Brenneria izadpanahii]|uniref:UPF0319 protein HC231_13720 n=1 Tax=Brenneria izadpanahii TaxID=2722756 RepID=A0ABX7UT40_9GAMM|nr:DUF2057 family protein [Brenneria izadpanahii]QTF08846.1 DUF2057 family protein [Brenneria izadpanahii]